jgi:hypothetical protein
MYRWSHHRVTLDDLIRFAWSALMRELAAQIGLSDVGLKKLLKSHGVWGPPQGHWNRVHAGRAVSKPPAAPARGRRKRPYIHVDPRLARLPEVPLPSSAGPFASANVPEDLEELRPDIEGNRPACLRGEDHASASGDPDVAGAG